MMVSFIIPVYKTPRELFAACMESVLVWPSEDVEFILVIDSPGHAIEVDVYAYAEKDKRVRVIRNDVNRGPSYSRNRGIDEAHGDYVMMVDADDCIVPSVCQQALQECRDNKLAYCAVARIYPWQRDGVDCCESHQLYVGSYKEAVHDQLSEVLSRLDMSSSGVWYELSFINQHHLRYPENIRQNEDFVFTTSILAVGGRVGIWDEYGYLITCYAGSLSQNRQTATFYTHQLTAAQRNMGMLGNGVFSSVTLRFYANHAYNQIFAPWHIVPFESHADRNSAIRELGRAAKAYLARYGVCLCTPARLLVWLVSALPVLMFIRIPLVNYAFRILRKFGMYYV